MENEKKCKCKGNVYFIIGLLFLLAWLIGTVAFAKTKNVYGAEDASAYSVERFNGYSAYNSAVDYLALQGVNARNYDNCLVLKYEDCYNVCFSTYDFQIGVNSGNAEYPYKLEPDKLYESVRVFPDGRIERVNNTTTIFPNTIPILYSSRNVLWNGTTWYKAHSDLSALINDTWHGEVEPKKTYLVNAPYAVIQDYENYNVFLEYPKGNLDMSEFTIYFELGGQPMNPENGYELDYTLSLWLPTKEYLDKKYPLMMEHDFVQNVLFNQNYYESDVLEWQKKVGSDGNSALYELPLKYRFYNNPETNTSGTYRIQLDYKDILDYLEYALGDGETDYSFREYYGKTKSDWDGYFAKFVFGHMVLSRMDTLVYTQIDDVDTYYGRTTTFTFLQNGNFVYSEVNKDALQNENMESDISDGINQAIKDELIQTGDKVNELQQNINNVTGSLGAYDSLYEGSNLWEAAKSAGSGLLNLGSTLLFIPRAIGSIFTCFPVEVQEYMGYVLIITLIVIIWRLFKGK